jgi:hypothetical protein
LFFLFRVVSACFPFDQYLAVTMLNLCSADVVPFPYG